MSIFKTLNDKVIVKFVERDEVNAAGIFVGKLREDAANRALVVTVGPGRIGTHGERMPITDIKAGDKVIVGRHNGRAIGGDGSAFYVIDYSEILAVEDEGE